MNNFNLLCNRGPRKINMRSAFKKKTGGNASHYYIKYSPVNPHFIAELWCGRRHNGTTNNMKQFGIILSLEKVIRISRSNSD